ncbi:phage virion morphogenesis protein [Bradyrhizobium sp. ORS 285]|nr:phage virion morphogenesis protein [Bradyrhizobium sp. ORS 285]
MAGGLYLRMELQGEVQLSRVLQGVSATVKNWRPAFEKSGEQMVDFFSEDVFDTEGAAVDDPWAALNPDYEKRKQKKYPDAGILQATGLMRDSFVSQPSAMSLIVRNTAPYFKFHQSNQPRTRLPRRVMMKLTENIREKLIKNMQAYFIEQVGSL